MTCYYLDKKCKGYFLLHFRDTLTPLRVSISEAQLLHPSKNLDGSKIDES